MNQRQHSVALYEQTLQQKREEDFVVPPQNQKQKEQGMIIKVQLQVQ
jgi:hypothetical protein